MSRFIRGRGDSVICSSGETGRDRTAGYSATGCAQSWVTGRGSRQSQCGGFRKAKDDSTGTVPLRQQAREQINTYLIERQNEGEELIGESPLFLAQGRNRLGKRLGYQGLYYVVKELGAIAGIKDLTPHRLRHTYATGLLLRGVDSLHARTLTRHKSESSFKRYAKRALAAAAERAFFEAIGEEVPE